MKIKEPNKYSALFELIKSLTKGEKRYFNLFANRSNSNTDNVYLKIFEILDGQLYYNESTLLEKLSATSNKLQINVLKNYLYNLILI